MQKFGNIEKIYKGARVELRRIENGFLLMVAGQRYDGDLESVELYYKDLPEAFAAIIDFYNFEVAE